METAIDYGCTMTDISDMVRNPMPVHTGQVQNPMPIREWKDITEEFFEAVKELDVGELQHVFLFGLFEAMSAIEMMDPKMDAGMKRNEEPIPLTFEKAVEQGLLELDTISYKDMIGLIDSMYTCLVSWLEGHSLAQTLFTCLYLHKPMEIRDKKMQAFTCAMLKLIDTIAKQIVNVKVYEEEDFQSSTYGYDLCTALSYNYIFTLLKNSEDDLIKKAKESVEDKEVEEIHGVTARLKFTRFFLQVLVTVEPKPNSDTKEIEMNEIVRQLNAALELIPAIKRSVPLGTQPEVDSDAPNPIGFSLMVNQRLLPPTFPRFTKFRERTNCYTYFDELVQRIKLSCKVIHCGNYHSALNFFLEFSKKAGACLLSRSILQHLFFRDAPASNKIFGLTEVDQMLKKSIREFIAPAALIPEHPLFNTPMAKDCIDSFFFYNQSTFVSFIEICGYNRARQRDKLAKLLDNFANLQDEAERVDVFFYNYLKSETYDPPKHLGCFGTWVLYYSLRAMSLYLLSGLELELYSVHEYLYIFWYLYEFLFGWVVSALTRADTYLNEEEKLLDSKQNSKSSKIKKPKGNKNKKMKRHTKEIMYNQALQNMCGGYYKGLAGFLKEDRIPQPLPMFNNEKVRYEHRFAPFTELTTPPPMPYYEFKRMELSLLRLPSCDLFFAAAKHFHQARTLLEAIPDPDVEMIDILRIAKTNFVVMNLLANGHKKESRSPPEFDFSLHKYYPIIKQQ